MFIDRLGAVPKTKQKSNREGCPFVWCGRQDLNLHGCPLDPKSSASANSATPAYNRPYGRFLLIFFVASAIIEAR